MFEGPLASDINVYQSRRFEKALDKLPDSSVLSSIKDRLLDIWNAN